MQYINSIFCFNAINQNNNKALLEVNKLPLSRGYPFNLGLIPNTRKNKQRGSKTLGKLSTFSQNCFYTSHNLTFTKIRRLNKNNLQPICGLVLPKGLGVMALTKQPFRLPALPLKKVTKKNKLTNYLQFLLYQDLNKENSQNDYIKNQKNKSISSDLDFDSVSNIRVNKNKSLYNNKLSLPLVGLNVNLPKGGRHKMGLFFPYRKSFVCYWLLPLMGLFSYLSSSVSNQNTYSTGIKNPTSSSLGQNWTVSILGVGVKKNQDYVYLSMGDRHNNLPKGCLVERLKMGSGNIATLLWGRSSLINCGNSPSNSQKRGWLVGTLNQQSWFYKSQWENVESSKKNDLLRRPEAALSSTYSSHSGLKDFSLFMSQGFMKLGYQISLSYATLNQQVNSKLHYRTFYPVKYFSNSGPLNLRKNELTNDLFLVGQKNSQAYVPPLGYKKASFLIDEYYKTLLTKRTQSQCLWWLGLLRPRHHANYNIKNTLLAYPFSFLPIRKAIDPLKDSKKKISKDKFYFIVLNSLKNSLDLLIDLKPNLTLDDTVDSWVIASYSPFCQLEPGNDLIKTKKNLLCAMQTCKAGLDQVILPKVGLSSNLIKLNHPFLFSNLQPLSKASKSEGPLPFLPEPSFSPQSIQESSKIGGDFDNNQWSYRAKKQERKTTHLKPLALDIRQPKVALDSLTWNQPLHHKMTDQLSQSRSSVALPAVTLPEVGLQSLSIKYLNFLSLRFKQIMTPIYPSILLLDTNNISHQLSNQWRSKAQGKVKLSNHKETNKGVKIEKIFRRYLSKKLRQPKVALNKKPLALDRSILTGAEGYIPRSSRENLLGRWRLRHPLFKGCLKAKKIVLTGIKNKTNLLLLKNNTSTGNIGNKKREKEKNSASNIITINSFLKNRAYIIKRGIERSLPLKHENLQLGEEAVNQALLNSFFQYQISDIQQENVSPVGRELPSMNKTYFEKLFKRKYAQKKYRRKKQRKETRRRKKRKRFYPRPSWSRYKMYKNLLPISKVYLKSLALDLRQPKVALKGFRYKAPLLQNSLLSNFATTISLGSKGVKANRHYISSKLFGLASLSKTKTKGFSIASQTLPLYSTKDFYTIKRNVLSELKRAFWKSYWLRANLKPYLNRIKMSLKEIEKSSTKESLFLNLRSLVFSLSGLSHSTIGNGYQLNKEIWRRILPTSKTVKASLYTNLYFLNSPLFNQKESNQLEPLNLTIPLDSNAAELCFPPTGRETYKLTKDRLSSWENRDLRSDFAYQKFWFNSTLQPVRTDPLVARRATKGEKNLNFSNKWQFICMISEHNRIMYERIQNLCSHIRENLTLNGQFKARPYKRASKINCNVLLPVGSGKNNNSDFWSKLGKTTTSLFTQSRTKYYGDFSLPRPQGPSLPIGEKRLYWAINKSNLGAFKTINKVKSLWINTKNREQSKANKTKKIFYNITNSFSYFLNHSLPLKGKFKLNKTKFSLFENNKNANYLSFYYQQSPMAIEGPESLKLQQSLQVSKRKLRRKEQKLISLGLLTGHSSYVIGNNRRTLNQSKVRQLSNLSPNKWRFNRFIVTPGHLKKLTNDITYWWTASSPLKVLRAGPIPNFDQKLVRSSLGPNIFLDSSAGVKLSNTNNFLPKDYPNTTTTLRAVTFLFHFCALISLISLSQIRDFIKFILIISSKVSKIYLHLIFSSLNSFVYCKRSLDLSFGGTKEKLKVALHKSYNWKHPKPNSLLPMKSRSRLLFLLKKIPSLNPPEAFIKFPSLFSRRMTLKNKEGLDKKKLDFLRQPKVALNLKPLALDQKSVINSRLKKNTSSTSFTNLVYYLLVNILQPFVKTSVSKGKFKSTAQRLTTSNVLQNKTNLEEFNLPLKSSSRNIRVFNSYKMVKTFYTIFLYSSVNALVFSYSNFSYLTYNYFLKSLNLIESFVRSIYTFFEKPGELIIDWMAYFFLVEWSSDLTNTIPDTVDTTLNNSLTKFSRSPLRLGLPVFLFARENGPEVNKFSSFYISSNYATFLNTMPNELNSLYLGKNSLLNALGLPVISGLLNTTFSLLSGGMIQRRFLTMYELFVNIACRPDTDLISRQQKGLIFWDLWSDLLIGVAEDSNINVSELSNLKEEQNRLLEKLITLDIANSVNQFSPLQDNKTPLLSKAYLKPKALDLRQPKVALNGFRFKALDTRNPKGTLENSLKYYSPLAKLTGRPIHYSSSKNRGLSKSIGWSTSQFLSYQGKDTELFIDLHPPKSFFNLTSIQYSYSINQPIGLVLCQIFSGLFYKQIAKNLLVVGPPGPEKSMLIQAIAGETELKIITDNAYRYAMVFRGVAVGIKLLRDVFNALTQYTPCIFLLEDIHAIGERRPFLMDENTHQIGSESSIFQDRDEIHEKNLVVYQLTKHIISHYKKPYRGDFSLLIPTNHFCFDLFTQRGSAPNVQRSKETNLTPSSPLSVSESLHSLSPTGDKKSSFHDLSNDPISSLYNEASSNFDKKNNAFQTDENGQILASSLQLPKNQLLAPPATSPFSVLVLKEEKKLKPKKLVKEFPWAGLPGEQYANVSKATYSIRVKVALLADMALSNLSVKLDMITDLLVIIDSVKGNRGFVVFATTHVPYILDPALRRPGRFDETLSLPQIPNLLSRWHILKKNISLWQYS